MLQIQDGVQDGRLNPSNGYKSYIIYPRYVILVSTPMF